MDKHSKEQRSKNMRAIRSSGSEIEILMTKALSSRGFRFGRNDKTVLGKPDFSFKSIKVAIFCDSSFWHGRNWEKAKKCIRTNREFWLKKIEGNIKRDKFVTKELRKQGWHVIRFWDADIKENLDKCANKVDELIKSVKRD